jgi:hypothetical protein
MLDHPVQFFLGLILLCGLLGWRIQARLVRRRLHLRLPAWRWFLQGLAEFLTFLILLVVVLDSTRFVGINFCLDLWADQTWCNHPAEGPNSPD